MIERLIYSISNANSLEEIKDIIKNAKIYESQKVILIKILRSSSLTNDSRQTLARKLIEFEENKFAKKIERTDIVTRIGPTLGLMGTLIPMGPGLAALGSGDIDFSSVMKLDAVGIIECMEYEAVLESLEYLK